MNGHPHASRPASHAPLAILPGMGPPPRRRRARRSTRSRARPGTPGSRGRRPTAGGPPAVARPTSPPPPPTTGGTATRAHTMRAAAAAAAAAAAGAGAGRPRAACRGGRATRRPSRRRTRRRLWPPLGGGSRAARRSTGTTALRGTRVGDFPTTTTTAGERCTWRKAPPCLFATCVIGRRFARSDGAPADAVRHPAAAPLCDGGRGPRRVLQVRPNPRRAQRGCAEECEMMLSHQPFLRRAADSLNSRSLQLARLLLRQLRERGALSKRGMSTCRRLKRCLLPSLPADALPVSGKCGRGCGGRHRHRRRPRGEH